MFKTDRKRLSFKKSPSKLKKIREKDFARTWKKVVIKALSCITKNPEEVFELLRSSDVIAQTKKCDPSQSWSDINNLVFQTGQISNSEKGNCIPSCQYIATSDWYIFPVPSLIYPFLMVFWRLGTFCLCFKGRCLFFWISPWELGKQFAFGLTKPDPRMVSNIWAYCQIQNGTIYPFLIVLGDVRKLWHFFERKNVFFHWFPPSYREPRKIFALGLIKTDPRMALNIWAYCQIQNGKIYSFIIVLGV